MTKGHPTKVMVISFSETGKYGHLKALIIGVDIFTGKKYEETCPAHSSLESPLIPRTRIYWLVLEPIVHNVLPRN